MCLALLLLLTSSTPVHRIAVLDVKARIGVTPALAQGLTDALVVEVRRRAKGASIISSEEVRSMLGFAKQKQKLGCQDTSCLAEIGGALGADLLVLGTLGKFGSTYLLSLQLVETRVARVKQQASFELTGKSDDALLEAVRKAVEQLFPSDVPPAAVVSAPATPPVAPVDMAKRAVSPEAQSHALQWVFLGSGAAAAVTGLVFMGVSAATLSSARSNSSYPAAVNGAQASATEQDIGDWTLVAAGGALAAGVVVMLVEHLSGNGAGTQVASNVQAALTQGATF